VDTVHAVALTQDGKSGTIGISFGTEFKSGLEVEIVTTEGAVTWSPTEVKSLARKGDGSEKNVEDKKEFPYSSGVTAEVGAFAKAIEAGKLDVLQTPAEALKDLEILQRLLESGAGGASVKTIGA
jgi:predicted dehydrogenase